MDVDYLLECAWRDTGIYKYLFDPDDNLTSDVLSMEAMRGRDFDSAVGRWSPGQLNAILRNDDKKYSPNYAAGPLYGYLKTNRPICLSAGLRESSLAAKFVAADTRYLMHADAAALSVGDIYWDMVVWVKLSDPADTNCSVTKWGGAGSQEYYLQTVGSRFYFVARNDADVANISVTANTFGDIPANTWCMVHFYHDPTANVIGIGINAGAHDTAAIHGIRDSTADFRVGAWFGGPYLTGDVGPLAIWKPTGTNLTAAQLTWLYNGGYGRDFTELGVSETDGQYLIYDAAGNAILPIGWQMNEVSGTRSPFMGTFLDLTEAGGAVSSEAGLNTKVYHGLWIGVIDSIQPSVPTVGALHSATLKGIGDLSRLAQAKKLDLPVVADQTGDWIYDIILALALAGGFWSLTTEWDTGRTTTGLFRPDNAVTGLELCRQMEDCEPGLLGEWPSAGYEGHRFYRLAEGLFIYHDRWHRLASTRSLVSQATFSDNPALSLYFTGIEQRDPLNGIYNSVQVTVKTPPTAGPLAILWTFTATDPIVLVPGQYMRFTAKYPTDTVGGANASHVDPWTDPLVGTDVIGSPNNTYLSVTVTAKSANEMDFTIVNTSTSTSYRNRRTLTLVQARGIPWAKGSETLISSDPLSTEAAASIAVYGLRAYPLSPLWLANITDAQNFCDYIISRYCLPHNRLAMTFVANRDTAHAHQALTGMIGDRVTVDADGECGLGINEEFYIENICHQIGRGKLHTVIYELVSCSGEGAYAILDNPAIGWAGSPLEYDLAHPAYATSRLEYE